MSLSFSLFWIYSAMDTVAQFASQTWDDWKNRLSLSTKHELSNSINIRDGVDIETELVALLPTEEQERPRKENLPLIEHGHSPLPSCRPFQASASSPHCGSSSPP
jgi:hypothetical protein